MKEKSYYVSYCIIDGYVEWGNMDKGVPAYVYGHDIISGKTKSDAILKFNNNQTHILFMEEISDNKLLED